MLKSQLYHRLQLRTIYVLFITNSSFIHYSDSCLIQCDVCRSASIRMLLWFTFPVGTEGCCHLVAGEQYVEEVMKPDVKLVPASGDQSGVDVWRCLGNYPLEDAGVFPTSRNQVTVIM